MAGRIADHRIQVAEPPVSRFLFSDTRMAWFWLIIRVYAGYQWVQAGLEKLGNPAWVGPTAGTGIAGFVAGALKNSTGDKPSVSAWYAGFLQTFVLPHTAIWSYLITFGELAVGIGLILGLLTGIAAFFGGMMNANYLLSGTLSTNPLLFIFATWLVLAWRIAGYWGVDRWLLPRLGVPGELGELFDRDIVVKVPSPVSQ